MATNTFVDLNIPEARTLADLNGIRHDLTTAQEMAQKLRSVLQGAPSSESMLLMDALSTAIPIRYCRAFIDGKRDSALRQELLNVLDDSQHSRHQRLYKLRSMHVAHSVNAYEENQVVARYWVERVHEEGITSIEVNHARVTGLSTIAISDIEELVVVLVRYIDARMEQEKAKLLKIVRGLPITEVVSFPSHAFVPDLSAIGKPRKQG